MSADVPDNRSSRPRRDSPASAEPNDEILLTRSLKAALLRDLSPARGARERVHAGVVAALGSAAPPSLVVKQAEAAMAARAAKLTKASALAGKSLASKLVLSGVLVASMGAITIGALWRAAQPRTAAPAAQAAPAASPRPNQNAPAVTSAAVNPAASPRTNQNAPAATSAALNAVPVARPAPEGAVAATSLARAPDGAPQPSAAKERVKDPVAPEGSRRSTAGPRSPTREAANRRSRSIRTRSLAAEPSSPLTAAATGAETPDPNASRSDAVATAAVGSSEPATKPEPNPPVLDDAELRAAQPAAAKPALTLADELSLVRGASSALGRKDPAAALRLLARYERTYPAGSLSTEARALRVIALCSAKRPDAASARDEFLRSHATSALAQRVRSACTW